MKRTNNQSPRRNDSLASRKQVPNLSYSIIKDTMKASDILKKENILRALQESTEDQRKELNKTFTQALKESSEKMYRTYVDTPWKKAMFWWIVYISKFLPK